MIDGCAILPPLVTVIPLHGSGSVPAFTIAGSKLAASLALQTMPRWVLCEPSTGHASWMQALNSQVRQASTPFVLFASADAVLAPTLLEKEFWFLSTHPRYAFVNAHETRRPHAGAAELHELRFYDRDAVLRSDHLGLHVMARRSAFVGLGGFDETIEPAAAAWEFWLRAAHANQWGSTVPEALIDRPAGTDHGDCDPAAIQRLRPRMQRDHPGLFAGHVPVIEPRWPVAFEPVRDQPPAAWTTPRPAPGSRRMLLIVPWLRLGGADKFNLDLCSILRRNGWELTIACTAPGPAEWLGYFQRHTDDIFFPHHFLHWADYPVLLRSLIHARRPDAVLLSNSELAYHLLPYLRSFHPEPVYLDYVHMEEEDWKSGGHARHSAGLHDQLDLTLVTSDHLRSWLVSRGASRERVLTCPIGVDPDQWKPDPHARALLRRQLHIPDDTPVLFHAGRICAQKQPAVLARTLQMLARREAPFAAWIAGAGEDLPWLEKFVADHALADRVRFLGELSPARTREFMAAADIFFLPSRWEGVALVLYEAMATGAVFVGADVGGQAHVATPDCAVLIPPDPDPLAQADRYAAAILPLLRDRPRRRDMARAARRRIEEHYTLATLEHNFFAALDLARSMQRTDPRQRLSPAMGQEMAVRAVEFVRLEWQLGQLWRERDYWRDAATAAARPVPARPPPGAGRSALRRVLRALRPSAKPPDESGRGDT